MRDLDGVWDLGSKLKKYQGLFIQGSWPRTSCLWWSSCTLLHPLVGSVLGTGDLFPAFRRTERRIKASFCTSCLLSNFIQTKRVITPLRHISGRPTPAHNASVPFITCPVQTFYTHTPIWEVYPSDLALLTVINIKCLLSYTSDRFTLLIIQQLGQADLRWNSWPTKGNIFFNV